MAESYDHDDSEAYSLVCIGDPDVRYCKIPRKPLKFDSPLKIETLKVNFSHRNYVSIISEVRKIEIPHIGTHYIDFSKTYFY